MPGQTRKATLDAEPLPTPPTSAQRVLLPAVVDGQSVLLRLDAETLALGELSITSLAGGSVLSDELLSAFDFDVDELRHVTVALADSRRYLDGSVVEHFQRQLDTCETDDGALGPAKVLPGVLGILGTIEEHAREVKPGVRRELLWYWHDRATEWAQEAGDTAMQGYVLLKKAQGAYDNRDALRMLMLAQATLNGPWQLPARVRAEATQQEARGLAMLGEPMSLIEQKLDDARRFLGDATPDDEKTGQLGIH
ncbi:MAG: XRE family transcriptional regulator, partial [Pseudonocardiaceae bacterium]